MERDRDKDGDGDGDRESQRNNNQQQQQMRRTNTRKGTSLQFNTQINTHKENTQVERGSGNCALNKKGNYKK